MRTVMVIPAYNEEKNIEEVVKRTKKVKDINKIVVVDDGSTDKTFELAKKTGSIALKHKINKGKGESLETAFNYILEKMKKVKYIVVIDADLQYDPEDSKKVLKPLLEDKADFVMGYRNFEKIPFRHRLGNFVWRTTFNILFGTNLKDTNCGLIGFKKSIIKGIVKKHRGYRIHRGYIVENSILSELVKNKIRITQVPVKVHYKRSSEIPRGIRVVLGVLLFILLSGLRYRLKTH